MTIFHTDACFIATKRYVLLDSSFVNVTRIFKFLKKYLFSFRYLSESWKVFLLWYHTRCQHWWNVSLGIVLSSHCDFVFILTIVEKSYTLKVLLSFWNGKMSQETISEEKSGCRMIMMCFANNFEEVTKRELLWLIHDSRR